MELPMPDFDHLSAGSAETILQVIRDIAGEKVAAALARIAPLETDSALLEQFEIVTHHIAQSSAGKPLPQSPGRGWKEIILGYPTAKERDDWKAYSGALKEKKAHAHKLTEACREPLEPLEQRANELHGGYISPETRDALATIAGYLHESGVQVPGTLALFYQPQRNR